MKKALVYIAVVIACIAFCCLFSILGSQFEGTQKVNPWAFTIGILVVAAIMALVHKITSKDQDTTPPNGSDKDHSEQP